MSNVKNIARACGVNFKMFPVTKTHFLSIFRKLKTGAEVTNLEAVDEKGFRRRNQGGTTAENQGTGNRTGKENRRKIRHRSNPGSIGELEAN